MFGEEAQATERERPDRHKFRFHGKVAAPLPVTGGQTGQFFRNVPVQCDLPEEGQMSAPFEMPVHFGYSEIELDSTVDR